MSEPLCLIRGKILNTTQAGSPHPAGDRLHLVRMHEGDWALVWSWVSVYQGRRERLFQIHHRFAFTNLENALLRFSKWAN